MRVPNTEHRLHNWRIDDVAPDFELKDVWAMPVTGTAQQFADFVTLISAQAATRDSQTPNKNDSRTARCLFELRLWLGRVFGWDRDFNRLPIPGCHEASVRDRLPEADRAPLPPPSNSPFSMRPVYLDHREAFMELSNGSVHALMHYSWVPEDNHYRARMAVYVKTRGWFGRLYMAAITPVRCYVLYPAVMRVIAAKWRAATNATDSA